MPKPAFKACIRPPSTYGLGTRYSMDYGTVPRFGRKKSQAQILGTEEIVAIGMGQVITLHMVPDHVYYFSTSK